MEEAAGRWPQPGGRQEEQEQQEEGLEVGRAARGRRTPDTSSSGAAVMMNSL